MPAADVIGFASAERAEISGRDDPLELTGGRTRDAAVLSGEVEHHAAVLVLHLDLYFARVDVGQGRACALNLADHKLGNHSNLSSRLNVYFNNGDTALVVSDRVKGNPDRLGHDGPSKPWDITQKTVLIDASRVVAGDLDMRHAYIRKHPKVLADLKHVLAGHPSECENDTKRTYVPHANKFVLD